jgi:nucleoside-diphosphate-sugar epimerase
MSFFDKKRVLVTGGAGFIGSHLVERLVAERAHVIVLDNLSTGIYENLSAVYKQIQFINGSVTDMATCIQACAQVEIIFHLAAFTSAPRSIQEPHECFTTNILGTQTILEAARLCNVKRFLLASSAAVYGTKEGACTETDHCKPTSPYGYSKWIGELLLQQYAQCYTIETVVLRYFNVFGIRQDPNSPYAGVIAHFREKMKHNRPLVLYGDGTQTRDFVSVETIVEANVQLAQKPIQQLKAGVYNIASGKTISLLTLIEQLRTEFPNFDQSITFAPERPGDIHHSQADIERYRSLVV